VPARQAADAELRQELPLIQKTSKQPFHPATAQQRQEAPLAKTGLSPARDQRGELWPVLEKPSKPRFELRYAGEQLGLEDLDRKERDEANDRPHSQRDRLAIGEPEQVIVEAVLFIPEAATFPNAAEHSARDVEKVLEEFAGDVLVNGIVPGQFE